MIFPLIIITLCCAIVVWIVLDSQRRRRAVKREIDAVIATFRALPSEEQLGYIHPASPMKPPGWTLERYKETLKRRDGAH